jgi:membrane carboxypeptidase/penicillin-binding protein PbpC
LLRCRSLIWILSQYLNRAPYGSNFIGIEAAARGWFGKGAKDLGIGEAAMLAGMVQAPSRFRPDRGYEKAFRRRDYVLNRMETLNFITDFDSAYCGRVTLADALVLSLNVPFVRLLRTIGVEGFGDKLHELCFRNQYHAESGAVELGLGMAIGNVEVSLVELTQAYATLARGGDGIFSRESAYLVSDILSGAARSGAALGHIADVVSSRFAWKTGTSSVYRVEGGSTKGPIMV